MTRVRSQLVGTTSLAQRARETGIDQLLRLGRGEEQQGGRSRDAVLSDVFEAVLASVYEDGGYAAARKVVLRIFGGLLDEVCVGRPKTKDFKTSLQERSVALSTTALSIRPWPVKARNTPGTSPCRSPCPRGSSSRPAAAAARRPSRRPPAWPCARWMRRDRLQGGFEGEGNLWLAHKRFPSLKLPHPSQTRFAMEDDGGLPVAKLPLLMVPLKNVELGLCWSGFCFSFLSSFFFFFFPFLLAGGWGGHKKRTAVRLSFFMALGKAYGKRSDRMLVGLYPVHRGRYRLQERYCPWERTFRRGRGIPLPP